jgi:hypothetical protein
VVTGSDRGHLVTSTDHESALWQALAIRLFTSLSGSMAHVSTAGSDPPTVTWLIGSLSCPGALDGCSNRSQAHGRCHAVQRGHEFPVICARLRRASSTAAGADLSVGRRIVDAVEREVVDYQTAGLDRLLEIDNRRYVIKYVASRWAMRYTTAGQIKVSETPALTWGTGTYVSPIAHPLSTALYGRCGLVARADDAESWRVFDARKPSAQAAYVN